MLLPWLLNSGLWAIPSIQGIVGQVASLVNEFCWGYTEGVIPSSVTRCLVLKKEFYSQNTVSSLSRRYQPVAIRRERKVLLS